MTQVFDTGLILKNDVFTGKVESTDLVDIDIALTQLIGFVLNQIQVSNPAHPRNKALAEFVSRSSLKEQIAIGQFADPQAFMMALSKRIKSTKDSNGEREKVQEDKISLPYIFIARDPSIGFAEESYSLDTKEVGRLVNDNKEVEAIIDSSTVALSYTIYLVGWHDIEVSQLAAHFGMWLRHKEQTHSFHYKSVLCGKPINFLSAEIIERHTVTFDNASTDYSENKVRALTFMLTVNANIARARIMSEVSGRVEAQRGELNV